MKVPPPPHPRAVSTHYYLAKTNPLLTQALYFVITIVLL